MGHAGRRTGPGEAVRRIKETQDSLYKWAGEKLKALNALPDEDPRKQQIPAVKSIVAHVLHGRTCGPACSPWSRPGRSRVVPALPEQLDTDGFLFNVIDGTANHAPGQLQPHRREELITKIAPVHYDQAATCPLWDRCL